MEQGSMAAGIERSRIVGRAERVVGAGRGAGGLSSSTHRGPGTGNAACATRSRGGVPGPGHYLRWISTPAMVAVIRVAIEPPSTARMPKRARSPRRSGARLPMPPIWIAIEAKLAKPHSA